MKKLEDIMDEVDTQYKRPTTVFNITLPCEKQRPIIVPFSDMHIGSREFKREEFEKNLQWCYDNKNVYVIGNGDWIECATRDSVGAGVYDQKMPAQKQIDQVIEYFEPLAKQGRLIAISPGNHENRVYKSTGVDIVKNMAAMLDVPYFTEGAFFKIHVGTQNYHMYMTHGASNATLPYTKIKGCLDLARFIRADIYAMGHVHDLQTHTQTFYEIDNRGSMLREKEVYFILTGHYLDWNSSYAQQKSMMPSKTGTPKIKLSGDKHQIRVSI
jgi:predicted phosphodiesterase